MVIPYPLADPCPVCKSVVLYRGTGTRPTYCGSACKASAASLTRADRRTDRMTRADRAEHAEADAYRLASRAEASAWALARCGSLVTPVSGEEPGAVPGDWPGRARRREDDAAARWLAEHFPEELASFGEDSRDGSTSAR